MLEDGAVARRKNYLGKADFEKGLKALDEEIGKDEMITAFAPIRMITAGGFLAVKPLKAAIKKTGKDLYFDTEWANEDMALFVTKSAREYLFSKAEEQNIVLFRGDNLVLLAAPMKWAVERKIRRIYAADRGRKAESDLSDCLAMLKYLREQRNGPLDREYIRTLNINAFDVLPDAQTMDTIAEAYREKYNEEIFKE
ncbi:uncharacterized protein GIQ15_07000 [Arthroderma uncinatum]|uniref:uncharacterized protein n=1 Tax=Arthroderma uncinatum TaxID=74035 RepID=UPI00144AAE7F|nr:uncharacterized protein GIQ15_07000 [Arthroderma uncinatum]KAF3480024.1 hypothetical protein GIQ15_07000 [Arthroderma uncinatum]